MNDWRLPWSAACLCGGVTMEVTAPPVVSAACHCRDCQKLTSGAYSLTLILPASGFRVAEGETIIGGLHRSELQHHFCPHCLNWLFTRPAAMPGFVNFRPTMLWDPSWVAPFIETVTAERLPGAVTGAVRSYSGWPPPEDYGAVMEAFAREGARPAG